MPAETVAEMVARARRMRYERRHDEAVQLFDAALAEARRSGAPRDLIPALKGAAQVKRDTDLPAEAITYYLEAIGHCRDVDDWVALGHTLRHLGDTYLDLDDLEKAAPPLTEAQAIYRAHPGDVSAMELANTLRVIAILREGQGNDEEARALLVETRGLYREADIPSGVQECDRRLAGLGAARRIWFDRIWALGADPHSVPDIIERLRGTPLRVAERVGGVSPEALTQRVDGGWSIQEQVGHLLDLEELWSGRVDDLADGRDTLREADLENRRTWEAGHNDVALGELIAAFRDRRVEWIERVERDAEHLAGSTALHPRLRQPMNLADLLFFVAEHDDHHLAAITRLRRRSSR